MNKDSFRLFYQETHKRLLHYVSSKVKSHQDAEEIVQDSYLGFLDSLPLFRGESQHYTFLVSIARHEIADYYRKKYAKKALKYVPFIDLGYTQDLYSTKETREQFGNALKELLPHDRNLILWKYEQKLSIKEIADKLEVSHKAAESRLFRARKAFQLAYIDISQEKNI